MKRNRNGFKILSKERPCSLSNYTKGALLYGVPPVCALCETERPGHLNVRAVLRHYVPNKGLHPLRCESRYSHNVKGVTTKCAVTPFTCFGCTKSNPRLCRGQKIALADRKETKRIPQ